MNDIRRYAADALAENGIEAVLTPDGAAFARTDGLGCPLKEVVYSCTKQPPDRWRPFVNDMIAKFASFARSVPLVDTMEWSELSTRVRSRIEPSEAVQEVGDSLSYAWALADGLREVLCIDFPDTVCSMSSEQVAAHGAERLREIARRNTIAEPIEGVHVFEDDEADVQMLYGASSFIASKILDLQALVPDYIADTSHGVVLGVPARNYLILHPVTTSKKMLAAINLMSAVCPAFCKEYPGPINGNLYYWKDGVLQRISRDAPETGQVYVEFSGAIGAALAELPD